MYVSGPEDLIHQVKKEKKASLKHLKNLDYRKSRAYKSLQTCNYRSNLKWLRKSSIWNPRPDGVFLHLIRCKWMSLHIGKAGEISYPWRINSRFFSLAGFKLIILLQAVVEPPLPQFLKPGYEMGKLSSKSSPWTRWMEVGLPMNPSPLFWRPPGPLRNPQKSINWMQRQDFYELHFKTNFQSRPVIAICPGSNQIS